MTKALLYSLNFETIVSSHPCNHSFVFRRQSSWCLIEATYSPVPSIAHDHAQIHTLNRAHTCTHTHTCTRARAHTHTHTHRGSKGCAGLSWTRLPATLMPITSRTQNLCTWLRSCSPLLLCCCQQALQCPQPAHVTRDIMDTVYECVCLCVVCLCVVCLSVVAQLSLISRTLSFTLPPAPNTHYRETLVFPRSKSALFHIPARAKACYTQQMAAWQLCLFLHDF